MSRFADQRLTIRALEETVRANRLRLRADLPRVHLPHEALMVSSGFVLLAAEVTPGIRAAIGLAFGKQPGQRRAHLLRLLLEIPSVYACVRQIFLRPRPHVREGRG